tara:strand:- start:3 stop:182 length:180 start_codon:yes stop_codon:yes gene_type:complete
MKLDTSKNLLTGPLKVVNVGVEDFAKELNSRGVETIHVDWSPPAEGDTKLAAILAKLGG